MKDRNIKYKRSRKGVLTQIYQDQKARCRKKNKPLPTYSLQELHNRFLDDAKFKKIHNEWTLTGHKKMDKPSIDRKTR